MKRTVTVFIAVSTLLLTSEVLSQPATDATAGALEPRLLIIDDDVGMLQEQVLREGGYAGISVADPDGGIEIIYALRDPDIKVLGITCAMGCSTTNVCMESVNKILELTGRTEVPVFRGADSPDDLGKPTAASEFIINTIMENPGKIEIMATAPPTNIATAMMLEPGLKDNWKQLHFATGEFLGALGVRSMGAEFSRYFGYDGLNMSVDPKANQYILEHGGVFPIYSTDVQDDAVLTVSDRRKLKKTNTPLSNWIFEETRIFTYVMSLVGALNPHFRAGMAYNGVTQLAVAIDPDLAEPPVEVRVKMEYNPGYGGYYFALSDAPEIPARPAYIKLRDSKTIEENVLKRVY